MNEEKVNFICSYGLPFGISSDVIREMNSLTDCVAELKASLGAENMDAHESGVFATIQRGGHQILKDLLSKDKKATSVEIAGLRPLDAALILGQLECACILIKHSELDINAAVGDTRWLPIHFALLGCTDQPVKCSLICKEMIQRGAVINSISETDLLASPLVMACATASGDVLDLFTEQFESLIEGLAADEKKQLGVKMICAAILNKDGTALRRMFSLYRQTNGSDVSGLEDDFQRIAFYLVGLELYGDLRSLCETFDKCWAYHENRISFFEDYFSAALDDEDKQTEALKLLVTNDCTPFSVPEQETKEPHMRRMFHYFSDMLYSDYFSKLQLVLDKYSARLVNIFNEWVTNIELLKKIWSWKEHPIHLAIAGAGLPAVQLLISYGFQLDALHDVAFSFSLDWVSTTNVGLCYFERSVWNHFYDVYRGDDDIEPMVNLLGFAIRYLRSVDDLKPLSELLLSHGFSAAPSSLVEIPPLLCLFMRNLRSFDFEPDSTLWKVFGLLTDNGARLDHRSAFTGFRTADLAVVAACSGRPGFLERVLADVRPNVIDLVRDLQQLCLTSPFDGESPQKRLRFWRIVVGYSLRILSRDVKVSEGAEFLELCREIDESTRVTISNVSETLQSANDDPMWDQLNTELSQMFTLKFKCRAIVNHELKTSSSVMPHCEKVQSLEIPRTLKSYLLHCDRESPLDQQLTVLIDRFDKMEDDFLDGFDADDEEYHPHNMDPILPAPPADLEMGDGSDEESESSDSEEDSDSGDDEEDWENN